MTTTTHTKTTVKTETQTNKRPAEQQSTDIQTKKKHVNKEGQAQYQQDGSESNCSTVSTNSTKTRYKNVKIGLDEYLVFLKRCQPKNLTTVQTVQKKMEKIILKKRR